MPPHCDSLDGPVVRAARRALEAGDVDLVLPCVHAEGEPEVRDAFDRAAKARQHGAEAQDVADRWFFETVVRVHRVGEGAPYTGLKPAGLDVGPVIPLAESAVEQGDPEQLAAFLVDVLRREVLERYALVTASEPEDGASVEERRVNVEASLGLQVWAHRLHEAMRADPHA